MVTSRDRKYRLHQTFDQQGNHGAGHRNCINSEQLKSLYPSELA